ncbi:MAG: O-antigen ligase family protein [Candidatus Krumholzibacteriia bacterium]
MAAFIPFSISGANISIMLGFLGSMIAVVTDPETRLRYRGMRRDPFLVASVLLVLSALPAVLLSEDLPRALRDWKSYWLLLIYFLVAYNLVSDRLRRAIFWVLFTSMSVSSLIVLVQSRGGIDLGVLRIGAQPGRPSSTLFTMTFAGVLYQIAVVNFAVMLKERRWSGAAFTIGAGFTLQVVSLLLNRTRGAWLALVAGLGAVTVLIRRRGVLLAGVAAIVLATGFGAASPGIRERAAAMFDNLSHPGDETISTRLVLWDISWEVFKAHPLLGVGMGDYSIEADRLLREREVTTTVDSHNIYLQLLATRGVVGFLPFAFFWFTLIRLLVRTRRSLRTRDAFGYHFVTGVIAVAVAVLVGALTENNIDDSEVFIAFMFLVGVARSFVVATCRD